MKPSMLWNSSREVLQITWENPSAVSNFPYSFVFKFFGILTELIKIARRKKNYIWIFYLKQIETSMENGIISLDSVEIVTSHRKTVVSFNVRLFLHFQK